MYKLLRPIQSIKLIRVVCQKIVHKDGKPVTEYMKLAYSKDVFDTLRDNNIRLVQFASKEDMEFFEEAGSQKVETEDQAIDAMAHAKAIIRYDYELDRGEL